MILMQILIYQEQKMSYSDLTATMNFLKQGVVISSHDK